MIIDIVGNRCAVEVFNNTSHQMEIDLSDMDSGIYFVKIINGDEMEVIQGIKAIIH